MRLRRLLVRPTPRRVRLLAGLVARRLLRGGRARRLLAGSPLFDPRWVSAQVGRPLSVRRAVRAYRADPWHVSPHRLFDPATAGLRPDVLPAGTSPLEAFVTDERRREGSTHPLVDVDVLRERHPDLPTHEHGPVAAWLAGATDASVLPTPSWLGSITWSDVRGWSAGGTAPVADTTSGVPAISVVVGLSGDDVADALSWCRELAGHSGEDGLECVLVTAGPRWPHQMLADLLGDATHGTTVVRADPRASTTDGWNRGGDAARGRTVVFAAPGLHLAASDLVRLAECLRETAAAMVQPLVIDQDELVASAGAGFLGGDRLVALLADHATRDARAAGHAVIAAPLGGFVAMERETFLSSGGFDGDLPPDVAVTRLGLDLGGPTVLCPEVCVTRPGPPTETDGARLSAGAGEEQVTRDFHAAAGFDQGEDDRSAPGGPVLVPHARLTVVSERPPALRWTIDLASPPGFRGESWGDVHFGRALAAALERLGQRVAVDSHAGRHRRTRDLDDVMLVLRGLDRVDPRPDLVNVEWIISHPDLVSADEARGFDLVFAASTAWAERTTEVWQVPVRPLLQCTDPTVFHPDLAPPDSGPAVLFVGNSRGIHRRAVRAARAAGLDLTLYGEHWEQFLPDEAITGIYVPNGEVGALYASAGLTLNDHWDDMVREGFMSNRLFDAAASGARIVSDRVDGIAEVFGGQVQFFDDEHDLRRLAADPATHFPDAAALRDHAARIMRDHSFDARAAELLDHAADAWARRR